MPKLKSKKGLMKRIRLTKKRKVKYPFCGKSHLNTGKKPARLRRLRRKGVITGKKTAKYIRRMLPYG